MFAHAQSTTRLEASIKRRAVLVRGDFNRLLESIQRVDGLAEDRKGHLLRILDGCVKASRSIQVKVCLGGID